MVSMPGRPAKGGGDGGGNKGLPSRVIKVPVGEAPEEGGLPIGEDLIEDCFERLYVPNAQGIVMKKVLKEPEVALDGIEVALHFTDFALNILFNTLKIKRIFVLT